MGHIGIGLRWKAKPTYLGVILHHIDFVICGSVEVTPLAQMGRGISQNITG